MVLGTALVGAWPGTPARADGGGAADAGPGQPVGAGAGVDAPLYDVVTTSAARTTMSEFLLAPARKAARARDWARAVPLYQALVVARGPGGAEAQELARLWALAGQNTDAVLAWRAFAGATRDDDARRAAQGEVVRLTGASDPSAGKLELAVLGKEARTCFGRGRTAFRKGQFADALVYFHMGYALAPDLPGFLRELGATYDKLGAQAGKREFYRRYLTQRPFGKTADLIRAELGRERGGLGTLEIRSSLPCTQVWINRQLVPAKALATGAVAVAPGTYKGLCFNPRYEIALFEYAEVAAGQRARLTFSWAIVVNQLTQPLGRISIEDPRAPGTMMDLGISAPEIGVLVPDDGRPLRMIVRDDSGSRRDERTVTLAPGKRLVVTW